MNCEDVTMALARAGSGAELQRRAAAEHLLICEDCRAAARAIEALRSDRSAVHAPPAGAFERAIAAAAASGAPSAVRYVPRRPAFWVGVGVGAALAAGLAVAVVMLRPQPGIAPGGPPAVLLAVNEQRDVSVALSSPEPLEGAEIRIALSGEIGLQGFAEQRELHWMTDLDRGVNQLTLPIVARGAGGGQVLVEVQHGDKRRVFILDVRTTARPPTAFRAPPFSVRREPKVA